MKSLSRSHTDHVCHRSQVDLCAEILRGFQHDRLWSALHRSVFAFSPNSSAELVFRLDALKSDSDVPPPVMQAITSDLSRLSKSLSDATGSLPSYDQRQCELVGRAMSRENVFHSSYQTATQGAREAYRRASRDCSQRAQVFIQAKGHEIQAFN